MRLTTVGELRKFLADYCDEAPLFGYNGQSCDSIMAAKKEDKYNPKTFEDEKLEKPGVLIMISD